MSKFKKKVKQNRKFDKAVITNFFFYVLKDILYDSNNQDYIIDMNMKFSCFQILRLTLVNHKIFWNNVKKYEPESLSSALEFQLVVSLKKMSNDHVRYIFICCDRYSYFRWIRRKFLLCRQIQMIFGTVIYLNGFL